MIPRQGPIGPIPRSDTLDRGDVELPLAWLRTGHREAPTARGRRALLDADRAPKAPPPTGAPALALFGGVGADTIDRLEALIRPAARAGSRIYVIADPDRLSARDAARLAQSCGRDLLFRRVAGVPCTALLTDRGAAGGVLLGSTAPRWWMPLTPTQGASLFRAALHLFWHAATDEAHGEAPHFTEPEDRPFDAPAPSRTEPIRFADATLPPGDVHHRPFGDPPPPGDLRRLLIPPSGEPAPLTPRLEDGAEVIWSDLALPPFTLAADGGALALGQGPWALTVELARPQAAALRALTDAAAAAPAWRLARRAPLSAIDHPVWLPGAPKPARVDDDARLTCGDVRAPTIRETPAAQPADRPPPPTLGRRVTWSWRALPPRAPKATKPDPLIKQWQTTDARFAERRAAAAAALDHIAEHQSGLARTFARLKSALLGLGRTRQTLTERLAALSDPPSALGPDAARAAVDELIAIEAAIERLRADADEAEHKARLEAAEEKQRAAYDEKQSRARADRARAVELLAKAEATLTEADAALAGLDDLELPKDDRRARRKKLKADKAQAEKSARIQRSAIERADQTLAAPFTFDPPPRVGRKAASGRSGRPGRGKGARFVPAGDAAKPGVTVPDDALPAVGDLRAAGGTRWLVIDDWQALDAGEREADRLNATLVARGDPP